MCTGGFAQAGILNRAQYEEFDRLDKFSSRVSVLGEERANPSPNQGADDRPSGIQFPSQQEYTCRTPEVHDSPLRVGTPVKSTSPAASFELALSAMSGRSRLRAGGLKVPFTRLPWYGCS